MDKVGIILSQLQTAVTDLQKDLSNQKTKNNEIFTHFYTLRRLYETGKVEEFEELLSSLTPHGAENKCDPIVKKEN